MSQNFENKTNVWYLRHGVQAVGPFDEAGLRESLRTGRLAANDLVWNEAIGEWRRARDWDVFKVGPWPDEQLVGIHSDSAVIWVVLQNPQAEQKMTGPWSMRQIRQEIGVGRLDGSELIWTQGMTGWARLGDRPEVQSSIGPGRESLSPV